MIVHSRRRHHILLDSTIGLLLSEKPNHCVNFVTCMGDVWPLVPANMAAYHVHRHIMARYHIIHTISEKNHSPYKFSLLCTKQF